MGRQNSGRAGVLTGFLREEESTEAIPLLLCFEGKLVVTTTRL